MGRLRFLLSFAAAGTVGSGWVAASSQGLIAFTPCLIKQATGVPCPTCGTTRAAVAFLHGDATGALLLNPLGPLMVVAAGVAGVLVCRDLLLQQDVLRRLCFRLCEALKFPRFAVPMAALLCANWAWNVAKGL